MGSRTCLLCGKTLSRIWVGAGEDFCSREHRNQYRLRRGMDRLQEANKVANVMRRRESPRQIAPATLVNPGSPAPRLYAEAKTLSTPPVPGISMPRAAASFSPRLESCSEPLGPPPLAQITSAPRAASSSTLPFPVRPAMATPVLAARIPVHVPQAPLAAVPEEAADVSFTRRMLVSPWRSSSRTVVGDPLRKVAPPEFNPVDAIRSSRQLAAANQGRALRVSLAVGFQIPTAPAPRIEIGEPHTAGITWPVMVNLSESAIDPGLPQPVTSEVPISIPGMRIPAAPPADFNGRFRWPGTFAIPLRSSSPIVRQRTAFVPFGYADEGPGKEQFHEYRN